MQLLLVISTSIVVFYWMVPARATLDYISIFANYVLFYNHTFKYSMVMLALIRTVNTKIRCTVLGVAATAYRYRVEFQRFLNQISLDLLDIKKVIGFW